MLSIAGQTAEPIGLKFCVDTHRIKKKKFDFFHGQRMALQLVFHKIYIYLLTYLKTIENLDE